MNRSADRAVDQRKIGDSPPDRRNPDRHRKHGPCVGHGDMRGKTPFRPFARSGCDPCFAKLLAEAYHPALRGLRTEQYTRCPHARKTDHAVQRELEGGLPKSLGCAHDARDQLGWPLPEFAEKIQGQMSVFGLDDAGTDALCSEHRIQSVLDSARRVGIGAQGKKQAAIVSRHAVGKSVLVVDWVAFGALLADLHGASDVLLHALLPLRRCAESLQRIRRCDG